VTTPTFLVMSVARKVPPTSPVADGSSRPVTARSAVAGVTWTVVAEALQLLVSLVSGTWAVSSAQARRKYGPTSTLAGIVTVTVPADEPPAASAGTARAPVSRMSPASRSVLVER